MFCDGFNDFIQVLVKHFYFFLFFVACRCILYYVYWKFVPQQEDGTTLDTDCCVFNNCFFLLCRLSGVGVIANKIFEAAVLNSLFNHEVLGTNMVLLSCICPCMISSKIEYFSHRVMCLDIQAYVFI